MGPHGTKLVILPSNGVWKKEKRIIQQAQKQRVVKDGTDILQNETLNARMTALVSDWDDELLAPCASGALREQVSPVKPEVVLKREQVPQVTPSKRERLDSSSAFAFAGSTLRVKQEEAPSTLVKQEVKSGNSKVQPAGKAKSAAAAKKRGRPKMDGCMLLRGGLRELGSASSDSTRFFGAQWTNTGRNWKGYIEDLKSMIEVEENPALLLEMQEIDKVATSTVKILDKWTLWPGRAAYV